MRILFKGPRGAAERENPRPIHFPKLGVVLTPGQEADVPPKAGRVLVQTDQAVEVVAAGPAMTKEIEAFQKRVDEKKEAQSGSGSLERDLQGKKSKRKRRSLFPSTQSEGEVGKPLAEETED